MISVQFQSTRPRGARQTGSYPSSCHGTFQSTRPRGARQRGAASSPVNPMVSIHAPAWGATRRSRRAWVYKRFQSTRPRGARLIAASYRLSSVLFQSTRPRGARPNSVRIRKQPWWFQSTRPRGARHQHRTAKARVKRVSIHAPAWGATGGCRCWQADRSFNPRARVGRDQPYNLPRPWRRCFNPRARVGRDGSGPFR